jgi:acetylornithine deacetylase/succinyl-diaminopimelate desuccinylase-like protein
MTIGNTLGLAALLLATSAAAQPVPNEIAFRSLYKEMVETDTSFPTGSCTLAAEQVKTRLQAAGLPESDLHLIVPEGHPKDGNLVAILPGRDASAPAVLLLAHIDVVAAKAEDWTRSPFKLIEENGYFYARGSSDDKAQAAIWADTLIRYRQAGYKPRRTIKMALTCGEDSAAVSGAELLVRDHRSLIDAGIVLNEGAWGELDANGRRVIHTVLAGEKTSASFVLEVTNSGGHSSRPVPDNAIYHLAEALGRISSLTFPIQINAANRSYLTGMAPILGGDTGKAMLALAANPSDTGAAALLSKIPGYNNILRTTCIPTMLDAGHAENALPQRARATINCRIFPGVAPEDVRQMLIKTIADPAVAVSAPRLKFPAAPAPPLTPAVLAPIEAVSKSLWPGVPVVPGLFAGGTDATWFNAAGIPTYGVSGIFVDPDLGNIHGLNERVRVASLMEGREFLYQLVKRYADAR